ncbi:hypothetical protein [Streptomyces olivochromogenes]|uniref:hypothetical protein n=1 Tax=Streptomyces olivochromogenes TaxID=1963 RepID=UPI001F28DCC1|nr:hypothetical protein [Streptomyces olivochromogenes]MCF3132639.1 hypothetical protein [Streptomyces olivochromogenes]
MVWQSDSKGTVRWIAGVALVVTVAGVTGCSKDKDSGADKAPTVSKSTASQPTTAAPKPRQSTAEEAVASWVTAVIEGRPKQACVVMAEPATASSPAQVGTPTRCNSNTPEMRQMQQNLGRFRKAFTPKQPTNNPKVEVAHVPETGGKAVVPADKITIDGQTLEKVILSNSTGIKQGQLDVKVESAKIKGAWYVTNLDFNVG